MTNSAAEAYFSEQAEKGVCSHAYIVSGSKGIGKLAFAQYCAKVLLCENAIKPCGYCNSCVKAGLMNHPDIITVGGEKAATIDEVRDLIRRSSLKPSEGDRQVFIIDGAEKLRAEAQNALLKLLEEPPESVTLFLLAESRSSLLPTVLSRGQSIRLDGMTEDEIKQKLRNEYPAASEENIALAAEFSEGNIGDAKKYLSPDAAKTRSDAAELITLALDRKNYDLISRLVLPKYKREKLVEILKEGVAMATEAAKLRSGAKTASANGPEVKALAAKAPRRALVRIAETMAQCVESLENSANVTAASAKLAADMLSAAAKR
ncbi:MAG: hypothetical protein J5793_02080 [Clostridia bacterium]|nr:hypothetical protein [Clostridia bacterium]